MQNRNKILADTEIKYLKPKTQSAKSCFLLPNKSPFKLCSPFFCLFLFCFIPLFLSACVKLAAGSPPGPPYTVIFETEGGNAVPPVEVVEGTTLSKTVMAPTRVSKGGTDYYFGDWYTVDAATGHTGKTKYDYTWPVTGDMTLYARWYTEQPANKAELKALIAELGNDADLNHIDVSKVTDMSRLFADSDFNRDISGWDVSGVTDMSEMFSGAFIFNQPIEDWDVSNVTDMSRMFHGAYNFNQPIGDWDVSRVTDMSEMFRSAEEFNQPIGAWNVSRVTDLSEMFKSAYNFNQPIGDWNVSNVTDMKAMFAYTRKFNKPIADWDVSNVTNMRQMFENAYKISEPTGAWHDKKNPLLGSGSLTNNGGRTVYAIFNEKDTANAQETQGIRAVAVAPGEKRQGFIEAVIDLTVPLIIKIHKSSNIVFDKRDLGEEFEDDLFTINIYGYFTEFESNMESESNYGLYVLKGENGKAVPDSANPVYRHYGFWGNRYKTNGTLRKGIANYKNPKRAITDHENTKRITAMSKAGVIFEQGAGWVEYAKNVQNKNEKGATP
ncbi:BspA family leucine-rich repeat surface protein [Candidatus Haliotispira prima]|uniref:BspA family leucine-rich repeat surface protein n=1 Tax=Candidatus Haliotispira prima TaxID=3034016 RepID=A0ABY8ME25_9SPIO|nr:BspA family leucine-rich repeat surface protein [Candidatus Haliotispira prima]